MCDNRVVLIPLHHANVEEAGVFAIHGMMHDAAFTIAVVLRCLHQRDVRIVEQRDHVFQPVRLHDIVGVDDTNHLRIGCSVDEGKTQRARLEAGDVVGTHELEAFTEGAAMLFDRQP